MAKKISQKLTTRTATAAKPRNRKAQDATLINVDALKKKVKALEKKQAGDYASFMRHYHTLEERVWILEGLVEAASRER